MTSKYDEVQQKTLVGWLNHVIKKRGLEIKKFPDDLADSIYLSQAFEQLTGKTFPFKLDAKPKLDVQKISNLGTIFNAFEAEGVKSTCSGEMIVKGNTKMILGFIWTLIRRFQLNEAPTFGSTSETSSGREVKATPKDLVKETEKTIQQELEKWEVPYNPKEKLVENVKDGIIFCVLVKNRVPKSGIHVKSLKKTEAVKNLKKAFDVAETYLDIPALLEPEDIAEGLVDEKSLTTYLSYYKKHPVIEQPEEPEEPPKEPEEPPKEPEEPTKEPEEPPKESIENNESLMEELKKELEKSKTQKKKITGDYENLKEELERLRRRSNMLSKEKEEINKSTLKMKDEIKLLKKEKQGKSQEIISVQEEHQSLLLQLETFNKQKVAWIQEKEELERKLLELQERYKELIEKKKKICGETEDDNTLTQLEDQMSKEMRELRELLSQSQADLAKLEEEKESLNKQLREIKEQYDQDLKRLEELAKLKRKLEKEIELLQDRVDEENEESELLKEKLLKLKGQMESTKEEETLVSQRSKSSETNIKEVTSQFKKVLAKKEKLEKEVMKNEEKIEKMKKKKDLEVGKLKRKLLEQTKKFSTFKMNEFNNIQKQIEESLEEKKKIEIQLKDIKEKLESQKTSLNQNQATLSGLEKKYLQTQKENERLRQRRNSYKDKCSKLSSSNNVTDDEVQSSSARDSLIKEDSKTYSKAASSEDQK